MSQLFGPGSANPFGGPSSPRYRAGATGGNPFAVPGASFDRSLMEQDSGAPALGYYATVAGVSNPFRDWLESPSTHRTLWSDYQGQYAYRGNPAFSFTDYLGEFDPYQRYMSLSPQERGETPANVLAPFVTLLNLG